MRGLCLRSELRASIAASVASLALVLATACRTAAVGAYAAPTNDTWSVTVLGDSTDLRYVAVKEAIAHWNLMLDSLGGIRGDVIIAFGSFNAPSFGYSPERLGKGFIGLRSASGPPLALPNVARNTVAHELGHVLGLGHKQNAGYADVLRSLRLYPDALSR